MSEPLVSMTFALLSEYVQMKLEWNFRDLPGKRARGAGFAVGDV
jgi:hypothetical protein